MRSLKARLLGWMIGGMALLLAVFGALVYAAIHRAMVDAFDASLAATARALAASVKQEGRKIEVEFHDQDLPEFRRPDRPAYYQLWAEDGAVLQRSTSLGGGGLDRLDAEPGTIDARPVTLPDGRPGRSAVLVFLPRLEDEHEGEGEHEDEDDGKPGKEAAVARQPLTLMVARDTIEFDSEVAVIRGLLVMVGAGTVLLMLLVAAVVVRQGLRPLDGLASRIAAIREDNLAATVPERGMPAEMAPVVRRLNELLARLADAFRRERTLTADVAHELRTPLAGLRSTLEVTLSRARKPADYQQAMADCLEIVRSTQVMVDNLLMLARLEGGQTVLHPQPVRLAELAEAAWRPLADKARARRIACDDHLPPDLECLADRDSLALVLANLMTNAAVYTNDGGRIALDGRADTGSAHVTLANTGCTLAADQVAHVFDRFWRSDAARADTGVHCGLGLALVQRIVTALGGTVSADVSPGGVFTVRLVLPAVADPR